MKSLRWVLLAAPLALLACGCAAKKAPPERQTGVLYAGFTNCAVRLDGSVLGYSYIRLWPPLNPDDVREIAAHEGSHRATISIFPTCEEYFAWLANPINRLGDEVLAHCVHARVRAEEKAMPLAAAIRDLAPLLADSTLYPFWRITTEQADSLITRECRL